MNVCEFVYDNMYVIFVWFTNVSVLKGILSLVKLNTIFGNYIVFDLLCNFKKQTLFGVLPLCLRN